MRKSTVDTRSFWVFDLTRHDEPPTPPVPAPPVPADPPPPAPADPPADPPTDPPAEPDKGTADDVAKWKAMARKHEAQAKANADAAKELADIKAAQLSDTEKLTAAKEAAEKRAAAATTRAVAAEVKALASADFADPTDAVAALNAADFIGTDGEIDVDGIQAKLVELLEAKPHWKKTTGTPAAPPAPRPDPSQGARPPAPPTNFKTASPEEVAAELAKYGVKTHQ